MKTAYRVLVFDSGMGGLSILSALRETLADCQFIYASDNAAFPYGTKDQQFLVARVALVLEKLSALAKPDVIVVACNTASTVALASVRQRLTLPIVGVVPAIKPAAALTRSGVIGILGTPGTVKRDYTQQLINDFAGECTVIKVGSSRLVDIAEQALADVSPNRQELTNILAPLFVNPDMDTVVLACTHFPLIRNEIIGASPRQVNWVDSAQAIASRVGTLCESMNTRAPPTAPVIASPRHRCPANTAIFTSACPAHASLRQALLTFGIETSIVVPV